MNAAMCTCTCYVIMFKCRRTYCNFSMCSITLLIITSVQENHSFPCLSEALKGKECFHFLHCQRGSSPLMCPCLWMSLEVICLPLQVLVCIASGLREDEFYIAHCHRKRGGNRLLANSLSCQEQHLETH